MLVSILRGMRRIARRGMLGDGPGRAGNHTAAAGAGRAGPAIGRAAKETASRDLAESRSAPDNSGGGRWVAP